MLTLILLIFLFLLLFAMLSVVIWTIRLGISPMPTSKKAKKAILQSLPHNISGKIVDLGSGWGTLIFPLARQHPNCTVIGYELSPFPYLISKIRHFFQPLPNLKIYRKEFLNAPLQDADIIVCYLYPAVMYPLKVKFEQELRPGSLVVSSTFAVPGWKPDQIIEVNDIYHSKIYIYFVKKN